MVWGSDDIGYKGAIVFERLAPYRSHLFIFSKDSLKGLSDESITTLYDYITTHKDGPNKVQDNFSKPSFPENGSSDDIAMLLYKMDAREYIEKFGITFSEQPDDLDFSLLYTLSGYVQHVPK